MSLRFELGILQFPVLAALSDAQGTIGHMLCENQLTELTGMSRRCASLPWRLVLLFRALRESMNMFDRCRQVRVADRRAREEARATDPTLLEPGEQCSDKHAGQFRIGRKLKSVRRDSIREGPVEAENRLRVRTRFQRSLHRPMSGYGIGKSKRKIL